MVKVWPKTKNKSRPTNSLIPFSLYNRGLTYRKLPEQHIKLSVLKLDGSSFSFLVARNATVARLKLAVEEEFSMFPMEEREKLWSLVWSHFCLCYEGRKLIHDTACIKNYGIKDGHELQFIQHMRVNLPQSPKNIESKQCSGRSAHGSRAADHHVSLDDQYAGPQYYNYGEELAFPERRSGLAHSLKQLLSCSRFQH